MFHDNVGSEGDAGVFIALVFKHDICIVKNALRSSIGRLGLYHPLYRPLEDICYRASATRKYSKVDGSYGRHYVTLAIRGFKL